jgi:hypothetical protein
MASEHLRRRETVKRDALAVAEILVSATLSILRRSALEHKSDGGHRLARTTGTLKGVCPGSGFAA